MTRETNPTGHFDDPLENYEPKDFDDPVEKALAEETVGAMQQTPVVTITPDTTIEQAVQELAGLHVACLLVGEEGKLLGLLSERDVLERVVDRYETIKDRPVREVMTEHPVYVYEMEKAAKALCLMAVSGYRHLPVLNADEKIAGIVSPLRVTSFLQAHFD